jgi:hypothetical protein
MTDLYNSDDDTFKNTPLESKIPPPCRSDADDLVEDGNLDFELMHLPFCFFRTTRTTSQQI